MNRLLGIAGETAMEDELGTQHVNIRLPDELADEIAIRAKARGTTLSKEMIRLLDKAINPEPSAMPGTYQEQRERNLQQDRVDGHRRIVRDLRNKIALYEQGIDARAAPQPAEYQAIEIRRGE